MSEMTPTRLVAMRIAFGILALTILFFQLLPLDTAPRGWAGPDLLMAFALAWCARRPDYMPPLLLAGVFFLADLLLQRPPGLWALLMLLACESVKAQARSLRDEGLATEMLTAAAMIVGVSIGYRLVLAVFLVDLPPLGLALMQMGLTLLVYPVVVFVTHALLGVRRVAPGDLDGRGGRL